MMGKKRWSKKARWFFTFAVREERKNVTKYGGYAFAVKRNLSH